MTAYLGNREQIYAESLVSIMAMLRSTSTEFVHQEPLKCSIAQSFSYHDYSNRLVFGV